MAQNNIVAGLAYLFGWLSGLVVFLISKDDRFAKFHGMQSILLNIAVVVVDIIGIVVALALTMLIGMMGAAAGLESIAGILILAVWGLFVLFLLLLLLMWLWAMIQAFRGIWYKLPIIGNMAENWSR